MAVPEDAEMGLARRAGNANANANANGSGRSGSGSGRSDGDGDSDGDGNLRRSVADDPFAERLGKTLSWRSVNMTLAAGRNASKQPPRELLRDVYGRVPRGEITAVMGPSGAGKTSLLNILAGRTRSEGRIAVGADIRLDDYQVDPANIAVRKQIAFVAQDDSLQVTATPREAIRFSAKLRLPRATAEDELDRLTERMLGELGLEQCADTMVGGDLVKGISGGERKRTSVGVELVTKPALVFLDEPTSGLDSFSAVQLVQVLKKLTHAGSSVLFTIHQPSSEVFNSFDHLILLNKGRVMYDGGIADVPTFFSGRGHPLPPLYNPSDWIMSVAQTVPIEELDRAGFFPGGGGLRGASTLKTDASNRRHDALGRSMVLRLSRVGDIDERKVSLATQIGMLYVRELRNLKRDTKGKIGARMGVTTVLATLIGIVFFGVGNCESDSEQVLQSHLGALIMILMMAMLGTAQPTLLTFPAERPVFLREYSTDHYSVVSYFLSRLTVELVVTLIQVFVMCLITYFLIGLNMNFFLMVSIVYSLAMASSAYAVMLGASVSTPKRGQEMLPLLFVPQLLFAGFFVAPDLIPRWLSWAQYLCSLTYAVRLIALAEFEECTGGEIGQMMCDRLVERLGAEESSEWLYWLVLVCIFFSARVAGLLILRKKATKIS